MQLEAVRERIAQAAGRAGRSPDEIRIVAVTKTHPPAVVLEALNAGLPDVGENKVQEAVEKCELLKDRNTELRWHLIGHLQRNKAKVAVGLFSLIHSLDSIRLADALESAAAAKNLTQHVLIQVNVAGEEQKSGVSRDEVDALVEHVQQLKHLALKGFMTMAPFTDDAAVIRKTFRGMRELSTSYQLPATDLSMGMSQDFEIAVEEGATMLRLGTVLFGERLP